MSGINKAKINMKTCNKIIGNISSKSELIDALRRLRDYSENMYYNYNYAIYCVMYGRISSICIENIIANIKNVCKWLNSGVKTETAIIDYLKSYDSQW